MADQTLPGTLPGLLRRGSPVRWRGDAGVWLGSDAVAMDNEGREWVLVFAGDSCMESGEDWPALDLEDATGRTHAAWWLAESQGVGSFADLGFYRFVWEMPYRTRSPKRRYRMFHIGRLKCWTEAGNGFTVKVPALANLDPDDPRTLPDGSRWVDAEALRLVCLHVDKGVHRG